MSEVERIIMLSLFIPPIIAAVSAYSDRIRVWWESRQPPLPAEDQATRILRKEHDLDMHEDREEQECSQCRAQARRREMERQNDELRKRRQKFRDDKEAGLAIQRLSAETSRKLKQHRRSA